MEYQPGPRRHHPLVTTFRFLCVLIGLLLGLDFGARMWREMVGHGPNFVVIVTAGIVATVYLFAVPRGTRHAVAVEAVLSVLVAMTSTWLAYVLVYLLFAWLLPGLA